MKGKKAKRTTKFTCGNAPWNRYVFTRKAHNGDFRQNAVFPSVKTKGAERTAE